MTVLIAFEHRDVAGHTDEFGTQKPEPSALNYQTKCHQVGIKGHKVSSISWWRATRCVWIAIDDHCCRFLVVTMLPRTNHCWTWRRMLKVTEEGEDQPPPDQNQLLPEEDEPLEEGDGKNVKEAKSLYDTCH